MRTSLSLIIILSSSLMSGLLSQSEVSTDIAQPIRSQHRYCSANEESAQISTNHSSPGPGQVALPQRLSHAVAGGLGVNGHWGDKGMGGGVTFKQSDIKASFLSKDILRIFATIEGYSFQCFV